MWKFFSAFLKCYAALDFLVQCRRITLQVSYFRGVGSPVLVQYVYPATYPSLHTLEILYCENLSVILLSDYAPVILCIFFSSIFVDPCCCWPIFLNCYRIQKLWEAPLVRGSVFMIQIKEYIFFKLLPVGKMYIWLLRKNYCRLCEKKTIAI